LTWEIILDAECHLDIEVDASLRW